MLDEALKAGIGHSALCHNPCCRLYLPHEQIHIGVYLHALKLFWGPSDLHQETAIRNIHLDPEFAFFVFISEFEDFAVHDVIIIIQKTPLSLFSSQVLQARRKFHICYVCLCFPVDTQPLQLMPSDSLHIQAATGR